MRINLAPGSFLRARMSDSSIFTVWLSNMAEDQVTAKGLVDFWIQCQWFTLMKPLIVACLHCKFGLIGHEGLVLRRHDAWSLFILFSSKETFTKPYWKHIYLSICSSISLISHWKKITWELAGLDEMSKQYCLKLLMLSTRSGRRSRRDWLPLPAREEKHNFPPSCETIIHDDALCAIGSC